MIDQAEFKTGRGSNIAVGFGLLALTACIGWLVFFGSEDQFLSSHTRKIGLFTLLEQAIGWGPFVALMLAFGLWVANYALVSFWKAIDPTPDVLALPDRLTFHPAVKRSDVSYEEVSRWSIEIVSGHPVVWIHFVRPYCSLQGLFRRKAVKLEGSKDQLTPLVDYFSGHQEMQRKFVKQS